MSISLYCDTDILAETTQSALYQGFYDYTYTDKIITIGVRKHPHQNHDPHTHVRQYAILSSIGTAPHLNDMSGWTFLNETDQDSASDCIKYLTQSAVLAREIPLLKTFATATTNAAEHVQSTETQKNSPAILVFGSETAFGKMAAITPDSYEIIGAYHENLAEDFLSIKKFDGIIIEKNAINIDDLRFLRLLHMNPDFVNIPVFMLGTFTLEEAISAQKQGVNLICPIEWPTHILQTAIQKIIEHNQEFFALKMQLKALKQSTISSTQRIFSPLIQKLFMASLETRLKLSHQGLARGTALVLDLELLNIRANSTASLETISPQSQVHYTISKQIFDLISHLSRSEDQIFPISENRIAVILPAAIVQDAMRAGARFKAILETSKFRPPMSAHNSLHELSTMLEQEICVHVKCHTIPLDLHDIHAKRA